MSYGLTTIPPGSRGYDSIGDPASPDVLVRDGWTFCIFYISQGSKYPSKITDATRAAAPARIAAKLDAGLGVLFHFESSNDRWKTGTGGGHLDGAWSRQLCTDLDYPHGVPVVVTFDTETRPGGVGAVDPQAIRYGHAFAESVAPWPIGVYGGTPIIRALDDICELGWKAMASSWSAGVPATVHILQRRPTAGETAAMPYATRTALDVDVAVLPFPAWGVVPDPVEPPPVEPPPSPDPPPPPDPPPSPPPTPTPKVAHVNVDYPYLQIGIPDQTVVGMLQNDLNQLASQGIAVDNNYGPQTAGAVSNWQRFFGLTVDGECGGQTFSSIAAIRAMHNFT